MFPSFLLFPFISPSFNPFRVTHFSCRERYTFSPPRFIVSNKTISLFRLFRIFVKNVIFIVLQILNVLTIVYKLHASINISQFFKA